MSVGWAVCVLLLAVTVVAHEPQHTKPHADQHTPSLSLSGANVKEHASHDKKEPASQKQTPSVTHPTPRAVAITDDATSQRNIEQYYVTHIEPKLAKFLKCEKVMVAMSGHHTWSDKYIAEITHVISLLDQCGWPHECVLLNGVLPHGAKGFGSTITNLAPQRGHGKLHYAALMLALTKAAAKDVLLYIAAHGETEMLLIVDGERTTCPFDTTVLTKQEFDQMLSRVTAVRPDLRQLVILVHACHSSTMFQPLQVKYKDLAAPDAAKIKPDADGVKRFRMCCCCWKPDETGLSLPAPIADTLPFEEKRKFLIPDDTCAHNKFASNKCAQHGGVGVVEVALTFDQPLTCAAALYQCHTQYGVHPPAATTATAPAATTATAAAAAAATAAAPTSKSAAVDVKHTGKEEAAQGHTSSPAAAQSHATSATGTATGIDSVCPSVTLSGEQQQGLEAWKQRVPYFAAASGTEIACTEHWLTDMPLKFELKTTFTHWVEGFYRDSENKAAKSSRLFTLEQQPFLKKRREQVRYSQATTVTFGTVQQRLVKDFFCASDSTAPLCVETPDDDVLVFEPDPSPRSGGGASTDKQPSLQRRNSGSSNGAHSPSPPQSPRASDG